MSKKLISFCYPFLNIMRVNKVFLLLLPLVFRPLILLCILKLLSNSHLHVCRVFLPVGHAFAIQRDPMLFVYAFTLFTLLTVVFHWCNVLSVWIICHLVLHILIL